MKYSYSTRYYVAQAGYGQGTYNTDTYKGCSEGDTTCQTTVDAGAQPGVPNTGLMQQPLFLIPAILGLALLVVGIEMLIRKRIRKNRQNNASGQSTEQ